RAAPLRILVHVKIKRDTLTRIGLKYMEITGAGSSRLARGLPRIGGRNLDALVPLRCPPRGRHRRNRASLSPDPGSPLRLWGTEVPQGEPSFAPASIRLRRRGRKSGGSGIEEERVSRRSIAVTALTGQDLE